MIPQHIAPLDGSTTIALEDLAMIGDRRSAALIARDTSIVWFCPERFDRPSLFAGLLDPSAGAWTIDAGDSHPVQRRYIAQSGVLETQFSGAGGDWTLTDWMPAGSRAPEGLLCRRFSATPAGVAGRIQVRPDYARGAARLSGIGNAVGVDAQYAIHCSHALRIDGNDVQFAIPPGVPGWVVFGPVDLDVPNASLLDAWLEATLDHWHAVSCLASYSGPYEAAVAASLRAIRLLCHEPSGGIVAAATASLPEVPGGSRNWDYRYVWLRDAGMIASALTRLGGSLQEGEAYLDFICASRGSSAAYPIAVFTTLDGAAAPAERDLHWQGYLDSRPVRIGNGARDQFQLDAFANVLLAAKLVYTRCDERPHWTTVQAIAQFVAMHWREPDHGFWEEPVCKQYTASKVVAACGLDSIAAFSNDAAQAGHWRAAAREIRGYVDRHCLTAGGAYAAYAGSEAVDISAALFPVWAYTDADTPQMRATVDALERQYCVDGVLFRRHLECADSRQEGAFLAGCLWMVQYWVMRKELPRARRILDAVLAFANDLGLLSEVADVRHGRLLGNFPQSFVHAALIGAVMDLKSAAG